jgi:putative DNA primase/helicase
MLVTFFPDSSAKTKREEHLALDELAELIRITNAPVKEALPWLKFARFGDTPNPKTGSGSLRCNGNVVEITGIVVDYDGEKMGIDDVVERLDKTGTHAIVYTSPSHTLKKPRWRAICPFSKGLAPDRHYHMVSRLNGLLGGVLARESWTLSQSYYFGSVNCNPAHRVEIVDGMQAIDQCDELDEIALGKLDGNGGAKASSDPEAEIGDIAAALDIIPNPLPQWDPDDCWNEWNTIGLAVWRASGGSEEGFLVFNGWSAKCLQKYDDEETRYRWDHFHHSPPDEIGFGTLVHLARQFVPDWTPPSRRIFTEGHQKDLPVIKLRGGNRPEAAAAGIEVLTAAPFYRRSDKIVYVLRTPAKAADGSKILIPSIAHVLTPYLLHELGKRAVWEKYDGRRKKWVRVDVPYEIATSIATMPNEWRFQPVCGVINTQTMRPDGTLFIEPGYDPQTHFVLFDPPPMPPIPVAPRRDDALAALQLIDGLLDEFPFTNQASRSVALSLIMSLVLRPALTPAVPLHVTNAPEGGTGKSYIFDVASALAIGEITPVISRGHTPEETEKRLIGAALEGRLLIILDNCNGELRSEFLCQAIERPMIKPRPLGTTNMPTIPNGFVCGANGNNIEIAEDLVRRALQCDLDANMEQPYLREFMRSPIHEILHDRGKYIAAVLTIARAYILAGPDRPKPLVSFEAWSDLVRGSLIWLGRADPVDTIDELVNVDPTREQRGAIFGAIANYFRGAPFTVNELIRRTSSDDIFRETLRSVAQGKGEGNAIISPERLAKWLKRHVNRIAVGYKLLRVTEEGARVNRWLLQPVQARPAVPASSCCPEEAETLQVQQVQQVLPTAAPGNVHQTNL